MTRKISINKANGDLSKAARYFEYKDMIKARKAKRKSWTAEFIPMPKKTKELKSALM